MEIVFATPADIEELSEVEIRSKKQSLPGLLEAHALDYRGRVSRWQNYFEGKGPAGARPERLVLKVLDQHKMVGFISGQLSTRFQLDAEIQSFYLLKQYQRAGLGTKLFHRLGDWLLDQGAHTLCVGFEPENPYRAFYLKMGGQYLNPYWICWTDLKGVVEKVETGK